MAMTNDQGFLTIPQWAVCMGDAEYSIASRRVRKLENDGYVHRIRMPLLRVSLIVLTQQGCDFIDDSLAPLSRVRISQFEHDATLTDLAFYLIRRFGPGCKWISERRLRQMHPGAEHIADGILRRPDGDVQIELELTPKSIPRLEAILAQHEANLTVKETWYVTDNEAVAMLVRRLAKGYSQIKVVKFSRWSSRE